MILKLTVLMLAACAAGLVMRRAPAALRHLLWALTLAVSLLLPLGWLLPARSAGQLFTIHTTATAAAILAPARTNWLMGIYGAVALVLLLRLVRDILAANRLVRSAQPLGVVPDVRVSSEARVPFAWGAVVVPAEFESWEAGRQASVLAHERAHIARYDVWTTLLGRVACALYWFHPLAWWASARMRLEADRACDDAVLRQGFSGPDYAEALVHLARTLRPVTLAPGAIARPDLERRVRHVLAAGVNRGRLSGAAIAAAAAICLVAIYPLAALSQEGKVYRMSDHITAPRVLFKVEPEYTEEARAAKISGSVLVRVVVDSSGIPRDLAVVRGLDAGLDANALAAVRQWKFQPGIKDGAAVDVMASIEINFRLE